MAPAPIEPNRPTLVMIGKVGAMSRLLIVWPSPSNRPKNV